MERWNGCEQPKSNENAQTAMANRRTVAVLLAGRRPSDPNFRISPRRAVQQSQRGGTDHNDHSDRADAALRHSDWA